VRAFIDVFLNFFPLIIACRKLMEVHSQRWSKVRKRKRLLNLVVIGIYRWKMQLFYMDGISAGKLMADN
jgi:hypothetical protein